MAETLLPQNSTPFERAIEAAMREGDRVGDGIAALRTAKLVSIPDSLLPFLIYEYGLGELTPFVPDQRALLVNGIDWQRLRGTPEAVAFGLDWLGLSVTVEEASPTRRRWNLFQIGLDNFPEGDDVLGRIEGIVGLSVPVRSRLWRGHRGYDVRAMEWSRKRYSSAIWGSASGRQVGGVKWSFGRSHDNSFAPSQAVLEALSAWIPGGTEGRTKAIVEALLGRHVWAAFRRADGSLIGMRRARAIHPVAPDADGVYSVGSVSFNVNKNNPTGLYIEALTDFDDGVGDEAVSVSFVWDALPADKPGQQWIEAGVGGVEVLPSTVSIKFGGTSRERVRAFLTV